MHILAAHLNTSRATEMYLTILELADIGRQNVVYHINLSLHFATITRNVGDMYFVLYAVEESESLALLVM